MFGGKGQQKIIAISVHINVGSSPSRRSSNACWM